MKQLLNDYSQNSKQFLKLMILRLQLASKPLSKSSYKM